LTFSGVINFLNRSKFPFLANSKIALSPRSKSAIFESAPCLRSNLHISNFPFAALSCNGVTFHKSAI
jgi:hypothetical protein